MAVLLGGRAAEHLVFGEVSTGAADDLARATDIARSMVVRFGMTAELGQVAYEPEMGAFLVRQTPMWRPRSYADGTAEAIDHAIKQLIDTAFGTALGILETNRALLETSARELLARETLGPEDLAGIAGRLNPKVTTRPTLVAGQ
jgi:cell division protease FtsH